MAHIEIDLSLCNKDGLCISECPAVLLSRGADRFPVVAADAAERCILCGHCVAVCPTGALMLAGKGAADLTPLDPALNIAPEAAEQFLRSRRSVRRFSNKPVEPELVRRCLDTARYAPSGMNAQPLSWIVAEGEKRMRGLAGLTADALPRLPYFQGFLEAWERGEDLIPVSYTHLDVYKRQHPARALGRGLGPGSAGGPGGSDGQVPAAAAVFHALPERLGAGRGPDPCLLYTSRCV